MPRRFRPRLEPVEARITPVAFGPVSGGVTIVAASTPGVFRVVGIDGTDVGAFTPFDDGFTGEVRSAVADVTLDGQADLVVAAGPGGGARVRVFDGKTGDVVRDVFAFEPGFRGGVYVAAADVNRDGAADVVVGAGEGGAPRVRVFDGRTGGVIADFYAFEQSFRGGVRVAAGDVDGDGVAEVIAGAGAGGAPRVVVFAVYTEPPPGKIFYESPPPRELTSFLAHDPALRSGVSVATTREAVFLVGTFLYFADSILTAPGAGGGPVVQVHEGLTGVVTRSFVAGDPDDRTGLGLAENDWGVFVSRATAAGPEWSNFGTLGVRDWTLPPVQSLTRGFVLAVDPAAGTLTIHIPTSGRPALVYTFGGFQLPDGADRVVPVRPGAAVTRTGAPISLDDLRTGGIRSEVVTLFTAVDGLVQVVESMGLSSPPPPPVAIE